MILSRSGKITLRNKVTLNIPLHHHAAYFSITQLNGKIYLYYRGQSRPYSKTLLSMSDDGVHFDRPRSIFGGTYICHNFYAFSDKGTICGLGGQYVPDSNRPNNDGLYGFESQNGIKMDSLGLFVGPDHPGYFNAVSKWGKATEFDGHISCLFDEAIRSYILYLRSNPLAGVRHIQFATSQTFGKFGPFKPLEIENFDYRGDSYYSPIFVLIEGKYFGFVPFVKDDYCCIRLMRSADGVRWSAIDDIFPSTSWIDRFSAPKNRDHAVNGIIQSDQSIFLYVHHNYLSNDASAGVQIVRYELDKASLLDCS